MTISFEVSTLIQAAPEEIYNAWLNSEGHTEMTGSPARASAVVGDGFEAWDGYIQGRNLELLSGRRIIQSWRTVEFAAGEEDSEIEVTFEPVEQGTRVTIRHTNLPPHGGQYEEGWVENYFLPMKSYFEG